MEKFVYNPALPVIKAGYPGNLVKNGKFTNAPWPDTDASFLRVIRWFFTPNPHRKEKKRDNYKPEVVLQDRLPSGSEDFICWLGHATFFIRINGVNILIDPIAGDIPFVKRRIPFPVPPENISELNYLLLSHAHRDHFDVPSLRKIIASNMQAQILGPLHIEKLMRDSGFNGLKVQEAGWYQRFETEKVQISFLPALHWYKRGVFDFNTILWGSFMIETNNVKIYFAGDSAYGPHYKEIREVTGSPDICLMPVGAYRPAFIMKKSHTNPWEAVQAFHDLGGKYFVPMHYGTYDLSDEPASEPLRILQEQMSAGQLKPLKPGEILSFNKL